MTHPTYRRSLLARIGPVLRPALLASACLASTPAQQRAGVLEFLYPAGVPLTPPGDVHLALPLRVGVAVAPRSAVRASSPDPFFDRSYAPELGQAGERRLLERVADAFRATPGVAAIEQIPATYLRPGGGFENVDQLRALFGIDLLAVLSYDQVQHQDLDWTSLTYWTLVGAYFVEGNRNETHTFVEISVFDIPSRSLLFNASGKSRVEEGATAVVAPRGLRDDSAEGLRSATDDALVELQQALDVFREQARTGTVRGPGTPGVTVSGQGAGALGPLELGLALLLLAGLLSARRRAGSTPLHSR